MPRPEISSKLTFPPHRVTIMPHGGEELAVAGLTSVAWAKTWGIAMPLSAGGGPCTFGVAHNESLAQNAFNRNVARMGFGHGTGMRGSRIRRRSRRSPRR